MIKIYTDGATIGNPGKSGFGVLILAHGDQIQLKFPASELLTNHEAEFKAAISGFKFLAENFKDEDSIMFYTDSRLLSDAIGKNYAKNYEDLLKELVSLIDHFPVTITNWIPDKDNHGAHMLALQALHS